MDNPWVSPIAFPLKKVRVEESLKYIIMQVVNSATLFLTRERLIPKKEFESA